MVGEASGTAAGERGLNVAGRDDEARTDLGRSFLALREAAGLTQMQVVAKARVSQTQLSRIEKGDSLPTEDQAHDLGRVYGLDDQSRTELAQRVKVARAGIRDARLVIQRGATLAMQRRWRQMEQQAEVVRAYQPAVVLGVLQTAAYASVVLRRAETSSVVQDRMLRHRRLLDGPVPRQVLVHTEGALRFTVGSPAVMAEQIAAVIEASRRPHVQVGVIPAGAATQRVTANGFHLYDTTTAVVGVELAAATLRERADVAHFEALFGDLSALAVFGDAGRDLLRGIAADHNR
ncbi:MAG: helix-turn-helix domain-containing protein [Pseudonocardia sp.]